MSDKPIGIAAIKKKRDEYLAAAERVLRRAQATPPGPSRQYDEAHVDHCRATVSAWNYALGMLGAETSDEQRAIEARIEAMVAAEPILGR